MVVRKSFSTPSPILKCEAIPAVRNANHGRPINKSENSKKTAQIEGHMQKPKISKPSSSGRAADVLVRERGVVPGFIGFDTSSNDLGYVPAVHGAEEIDSLVDADFRMVLRKLSKRDAVTKLKDHDRRVREASGQAMEQLAIKVGRSLAPFLKSIMGHWLLSQCDTYAPAASAANVAFQSAFPGSKQSGAIAFCKEEILTLLPLMETALKIPRLQGSPLFRQITHMVVSWEKRSSIQTNDETNETFLSFMSDFWLGIAQLCIKYVDNRHADENVLQGISLLLQVLKNPDTEGKRLKNVNIKFSDFEDQAEKSCNYDSLSSETKELNKYTVTSNMSALEQNTLTGKHLEDLVCELATLNMIYINQQNSEKHLKFLSVILSSFPSFRLFQELLDSESEKQQIYLDDTCDLASVLAENPAVQFLMKKLIIWLKEDTGNNTDFLVDMLYSILHCCNRRDETKLILDHITKMELRCSILVQIVKKANEDSSKFDAVSNWLKGDVLGENILKLTDELLTLGLKEPNILKSDCSSLIGLVISQQVHNGKGQFIGISPFFIGGANKLV
ncbi:LTN1 ligase, partial [Polypterus senegalus]|nr:LTN1 ligase [Polypterus senegalus]